MDETWWNCWHWWDWKHERGLDSACESVPGMFTVRCWTHDPWRSMKPKPTAKSSQATGQKLSTGEPRIWVNLQNWLGENKSDYQIMRGQNRYVYFLRLTIFSTTWPKGHRWSQSRHLFDVSSVHIVWIILSPRCCLHICSAQGMKYKAWHRE